MCNDLYIIDIKKMAEWLPNMGKIQILMGNLIFQTQKSFLKEWDTR